MIGLAYEFRATAYLAIKNNIWQIKTKYLDSCAEAFQKNLSIIKGTFSGNFTQLKTL